MCNLGREVLTSRKWHGSRVDKRPPVPLQSWAVYQHLWQPSFVCSFRLSCNRLPPLASFRNGTIAPLRSPQSLHSAIKWQYNEYCSSFGGHRTSKMTKTKNVPVVSLGTRYIHVLGIPKSIAQSRDSATIVDAQSRDCAVSLCNLEIGTQFQDSENAQRNLEIAQIPKLRGTYLLDCHINTCTYMAWHGCPTTPPTNPESLGTIPSLKLVVVSGQRGNCLDTPLSSFLCRRMWPTNYFHAYVAHATINDYIIHF